jgi:hypothetical protein
MHERRSIGRRWIYRSALLSIPQLKLVCACRLRDLTEKGAGIRVEKISLLPIEFELSIDGFRSCQRCQLIWRQGEFVGVFFR